MGRHDELNNAPRSWITHDNPRIAHIADISRDFESIHNLLIRAAIHNITHYHVADKGESDYFSLGEMKRIASNALNIANGQYMPEFTTILKPCPSIQALREKRSPGSHRTGGGDVAPRSAPSRQILRQRQMRVLPYERSRRSSQPGMSPICCAAVISATNSPPSARNISRAASVVRKSA